MNVTPFVLYQIEIEPLTPVHVGSGLTIEPYEYDLVEDAEFCWLVVLDVDTIIAEASDQRRAQFDQLCDRADYLALRRWLRQNAVAERHTRWRVRVDEDAFHEIRRNINNPNRLGQIHLFTRDPATGQPYLPGSSIKGAIRTALVDHIARQSPSRLPALASEAQKLSKATAGGARFEAKVLGNLKQGRPDLYADPFRQLAFADAHLPQDACWIDRIQIIGPRGRPASGAEKIPIYRDLLVPPYEENQSLPRMQLRLYCAVVQRTLPQQFDVEAICNACNSFYRPRLERELERFVHDAECRKELLDCAGNVSENQCLLRVGRHSHFECVTLGEPFHRPPRRGVGRSRSYVGGTLPLGWLRLSFQKVQPP